ncbi:MAG: S-layer homology domain-containing protein [Actinomycetota bacterium]
MLFSHLRRRALWSIGLLALLATGLSSTPATASSGFGDVRIDDWFAAPVQWLVDEDITTGVSTGCFGPGDAVSRGQLATFLWRYADEPSAPPHGFVDVTPDRYYDDAVAWLSHSGITTGTSPITFSPQQPITRGMVAAFLWRYAGEPSAPDAGFSDVPGDAFYADAVDWMVAAGITNGTSSSTFSPNRTLNRAEFATFLYRFDGEPAVTVEQGGTCLATGFSEPVGIPVFVEDFAEESGMDRFLFDIHHRDDSLVNQTAWYGDHGDNGDGTCGGPDTARLITRGDRAAGFNDDWFYWCSLGTGHMMTSIGSTAGYSIGSFTPHQSFVDVVEIRWDINHTDLGGRQFPEVKLIPSWNFDTQNLPCVPDIPCDTDDYDTLGAVGVSSINGTMFIGTPQYPDGESNDQFSGMPCAMVASYCFQQPTVDLGNDGATRLTNVFRDNGNGTVTWLIEGTTHNITVPGSFPDGPVRVVFADHNYTQEKAVGAIHPATGQPRTTWHWDSISIAVDESSLGLNALTADEAS